MKFFFNDPGIETLDGRDVKTLYVVLRPNGELASIDPPGCGEGWADFESDATVFSLRATAKSIADEFGGEVIPLHLARSDARAHDSKSTKAPPLPHSPSASELALVYQLNQVRALLANAMCECECGCEKVHADLCTPEEHPAECERRLACRLNDIVNPRRLR